ncbi:MAG: HdeD family acid-resistance protein [bacterium]
MTTAVANADVQSDAAERHLLGKKWPMFLVAGLLMVALGTFAIGWMCLATLTLATVWIFGAFLVVGGVASVLSAFWAGRWSGRLLHVLVGLMYLFVGLMFMNEPKDNAVRLTLIIAVFLIATGIIRIVVALSERVAGRNSVLFNGVVSLILGILIYRQLPASGLWAIGLFIGLEVLFNGWTWVMLSMIGRRAKQTGVGVKPA